MDEARGPRPGRATGTKPPRAAGTQESKLTIRESRTRIRKSKACRRTPCREKAGGAGKQATGLSTKTAPTTSKPETRNEAPSSPCLPPRGATSTSPSTGKVATSCRTHMGPRGNSCCCWLLHSVWLELQKYAAADTMHIAVEDVVAEGSRQVVSDFTPATPGEATRAMPEAGREATKGRTHFRCETVSQSPVAGWRWWQCCWWRRRGWS